jgi:hypothetical protein
VGKTLEGNQPDCIRKNAKFDLHIHIKSEQKNKKWPQLYKQGCEKKGEKQIMNTA